MAVLRAALPLLATRPVQRLLRTLVQRRLRGPGPDARRRGVSRFYGEVRRPDGAVAAARLHAPEAYTLTAHTAVACAERSLAGDVRPGYATPALAYGADFILSIAGVRRDDL
jgi:saccharopine dehydrogenase (NAD+, L-lysine-forming)